MSAVLDRRAPRTLWHVICLARGHPLHQPSKDLSGNISFMAVYHPRPWIRSFPMPVFAGRQGTDCRCDVLRLAAGERQQRRDGSVAIPDDRTGADGGARADSRHVRGHRCVSAGGPLHVGEYGGIQRAGFGPERLSGDLCRVSRGITGAVGGATDHRVGSCRRWPVPSASGHVALPPALREWRPSDSRPHAEWRRVLPSARLGHRRAAGRGGRGRDRQLAAAQPGRDGHSGERRESEQFQDFLGHHLGKQRVC